MNAGVLFPVNKACGDGSSWGKRGAVLPSKLVSLNVLLRPQKFPDMENMHNCLWTDIFIKMQATALRCKPELMGRYDPCHFILPDRLKQLEGTVML